MANSKNSAISTEFRSVTFRRDDDYMDGDKPSVTITLGRDNKDRIFNPEDRELFATLYHRGKLVELYPGFRVVASERWDFANPVPEEIFLEDVSILGGGTCLSFSFTVSAIHPELLLGTDDHIEADELYEILAETESRQNTAGKSIAATA